LEKFIGLVLEQLSWQIMFRRLDDNFFFKSALRSARHRHGCPTTIFSEDDISGDNLSDLSGRTGLAALPEPGAGLLPLALRAPLLAVLHPVHFPAFFGISSRLPVRRFGARRRGAEGRLRAQPDKLAAAGRVAEGLPRRRSQNVRLKRGKNVKKCQKRSEKMSKKMSKKCQKNVKEYQKCRSLRPFQ
jgi:hypothetical protein